jgi:predicted nucleotidyltransferase
VFLASDEAAQLEYDGKSMLLSKQDILAALVRLGELADAEGQHVQLIVVGGAAMALAYNARLSTRDVDAIFLVPPEASDTRRWAGTVAEERGWEPNWLNDGAKGFLNGLSVGDLLLQSRGVEVRQVSAAQLLAMKLSAWRDDTDIEDAKRLLIEFPRDSLEMVWAKLEPFLIPSAVQKARYALEDVWGETHDET